MQSQSPVRIILRLREWPDQDLDVTTASTKRPSEVRDALLEAIREVELRSTDIALLRIENIFQASLKKPWKEPRNFRSILEAGRQGKLEGTEARFYKHGQQYGVGVLSAATKADPSLFSDIDALPDEELIKLVGNIMKYPWKSAISDVIEEFEQTPGQIYIPDPPPRLTRPRLRRKLEQQKNTTHPENLRSPIPQLLNPWLSNTNKSIKRRRPSPQITSARDTRTQDSFQSPQLPIPHARLLLQPTPAIQAFPRTVHSQFETQLMYFEASTEPQTLFGQERLSIAQIPRQEADRRNIYHDQESLQSGQGEGWIVPGKEFIPGRPQLYHDQESLQSGQGEGWIVPGKEFIPGRPHIYNDQDPQIGQSELLFCNP